MSSAVTGIEFLSKTRSTYADELSFANQGLKLDTAEQVKDILNKILTTKPIKVLRLDGNTVSPAAAEELAKGLKEHPELERFIGNDLFTSRLKDEIPLALRSLCGAFQASGAQLVEINLSDNAFGPIGLDALVSFFQSSTCFSLKEIRMHNNGLGPQGAIKFAGALEDCFKNSNGKLQLKVFICGRNRLEGDGSAAISRALKAIGSLEEIQMPQNGIRPFSIENVAEALSANPNLKIVNLNDNTFCKRGGEAMSKALIKLQNLEYVNFGDCLLKSKGALLLVRSLVNNKNLKELILSFNEIDATSGVEISQCLLSPKSGLSKLTFIDLNGNKFGEDTKVEIEKMFAARNGNLLGTLEEDEGEDEEGEEDDEDDVDEEDEEEEEEEEYDENDEDYEDYEEGDEEEYDEEEEEKVTEKYGNMNINSQRPNLFADLIRKNQEQPPSQQQPLFTNGFNNNQGAQPLFANGFNQGTKTAIFGQNPLESFIRNPDICSLGYVTEGQMASFFKSNNYDATSLLTILYLISRQMDHSGEANMIAFNSTDALLKNFFTSQNTNEGFASVFLTFFGLLKSEDKKFKPAEIDDNFRKILNHIFHKNLMPNDCKEFLVSYLKLNSKGIKKNQDQLLTCLN